MNIKILPEIIKNLGAVIEKKEGPLLKRINLVRLNAYIALIIVFVCFILLMIDTLSFFISIVFH